MKTIKLLVELTYNSDTMHGDDPDGIVWFNDEILGNDVGAINQHLVANLKQPESVMKTYAELEREAYMAGNTTLAKLYALLDDAEQELLSREYGGT